jgi:hypothetical protein
MRFAASRPRLTVRNAVLIDLLPVVRVVTIFDVRV